MRLFTLIVLAISQAHAAGLGLLTARGSVRLNGFRVWDNGTVFDNMDVETEKVAARITLQSGAEILLAPVTRIRIERGSVTVAMGSVLIRRPGDLRVDAIFLTRDSSGAIRVGPYARSIPGMLDSLVENRPLSQGP